MKTSDIVVGEEYAVRVTAYAGAPEKARVTAVGQPLKGATWGNRNKVVANNGVAVTFDDGQDGVYRPHAIECLWAEYVVDRDAAAKARAEAERRLAEDRASRAAFAVRLHHRMAEAGLPNARNAYSYNNDRHAALVKAGLPQDPEARFYFATPVPGVDRLVEKGEVVMDPRTLAALLGIEAPSRAENG